MAVQVATKVNTIIDRFGTTVTIKDRVVGSYDQYGNPVYNYPFLATEKALVEPYRNPNQRLLPAGEIQEDVFFGFFRSDSVVDVGRRISYTGVDFQVTAIRKAYLGDVLSHIEARMQRVI